MRRYEDLIRDGAWPPTNRETILFMIGMFIGGLVGWSAHMVFGNG